MGTAYAVPYDYARPLRQFPTQRGPARKQPTSFPLRSILAARAEGRSAWEGASGRRATREVGGGRRGGRQKRGMERGERGQRCHIKRRVGGGIGGTRPADGVAMGLAIKRGAGASSGREGQRERRREIHLRDGRRRGDMELPWGAKRTRRGKGRPPGLGVRRPLGSRGKLWGLRGLLSGPQFPRSGIEGWGPQGLQSG